MKNLARVTTLIAALISNLAVALASFAQQSPAPFAFRHGLTSDQYQTTFNQLAEHGFRLKSITGYVSHGLRFAGLWERVIGPQYIVRHNMTSAQYQSEFNSYTAAGYRPTYINGYEFNGIDLYAAIWERSTGPAWAAFHRMTESEHLAVFQYLTRQGYRMTQISGYPQGGSVRFATIYERSFGPEWIVRHALSSSAFQETNSYYSSQGFRIKSISGYQIWGADQFAVIWERSGAVSTTAHHSVPQIWISEVYDRYLSRGYRPLFIGGFTSGFEARFNGVWENPRN